MDAVESGVGADEFEGGCLCGAIRFRVGGTATKRCYCHCRSCRLASGAPFVAWATFPSDRLRLVSGKLAEYASSESVVRGFCRDCGTTLTYAHRARPDEIDVSVATLDEPASLEPESHIWVSHKVPWVALDGALPRYPEWRKDTA